MLKVFIVDDETRHRDAIRDAVDWRDLGLVLAGEAKDGVQALEQLVSAAPDILITDVRMPHLDGLSLAKAAREFLPRLRVIFVSGFDEFDYVSEALRLSAAAYVLKPVDQAELGEILCKLVEERRRELRDGEEQEALRRRVQESLPILRERFLREWLLGRVEPGRLPDALAYHDLKLGKPPYGVLALRAELPDNLGSGEGEEEREVLRAAIDRGVGECLRGEAAGLFTWLRDAEMAVVLWGAVVTLDADRLQAAAEEVAARIRESSGLSALIGVGNPAADPAGVIVSARQARHALRMRFTPALDGGVVHYRDTAQEIGDPDFAYAELEAKVMETIRSGDGPGTVEIARARLTKLCGNTAHGYLRSVCLSLALAARRAFSSEEEDKAGGLAADDAFWRLADDKLSPAQTVSSCLDYLSGKALRAAGLRRTRRARLAARLEETASRRYAEDLSLARLAEELHLTPAYLGTIFREETGLSFQDYLTQVRMDRAKELLADFDLPVCEVASRTGFSNVSYFCSVFRNKVGKAPKTYRESLMGGTPDARA
ncbi:MAG: response regulator [Bacteroidota bacterium]